MENKPIKCIDPVIQYCQECSYGTIIYPDWVETYEDSCECCFETKCMYGFENDTPTEEDIIRYKNF